MTSDTDVLDLVPILKLRQLLNLALAPVKPRAEFRAWLKGQLMADAARTRGTNHLPEWLERGDWLLRPGRREIIIGAAVGSVFSLAGLIALLIHVRTSSKGSTSQAA